MITKEQAHEIFINYLKERKREYTSIRAVDKIGFYENDEIPYGKRKGEKADVYITGYGEIWGNEERSMLICMDANTGEVLYSMSPHGWIEGIEDDED